MDEVSKKWHKILFTRSKTNKGVTTRIPKNFYNMKDIATPKMDKGYKWNT